MVSSTISSSFITAGISHMSVRLGPYERDSHSSDINNATSSVCRLCSSIYIHTRIIIFKGLGNYSICMSLSLSNLIQKPVGSASRTIYTHSHLSQRSDILNLQIECVLLPSFKPTHIKHKELDSFNMFQCIIIIFKIYCGPR